MAKKNYNLEGKTTETDQKNLAVATMAANQFLANKQPGGDDIAGMLEGFEDKSLPPIIKTRGLAIGDVIIGEIDSFGEYDDGKKIQTALVTVHIMRPNPATRSFERVGIRGALPVGAVLGRALGVTVDKKLSPAEINQQIQSNGYGPGTIIAMRYNGTGKERNNQNAPHLWDIKIKKAGAAEIEVKHADHGNKKAR